MDETTQQQQWKSHKHFYTYWRPNNQYWSQWYWCYNQIHLQLLWSRYIFKYFIWSPAFMPVVKCTKYISSNTCAFSSCNWATYIICLYAIRVSLEAVSTRTDYTWSNILGLEAVFSVDIFLHPFMARLYFIWCPFFTEKLFVHWRIMWQLFLQEKQNELDEVLQVWRLKI